ncbi:hypothetical protein J6590_079858 [Homalodisca vitripennis]|nr:hypothetical protein J6590_079858 [Homalodisca vitripennis]
MCVRYYPATHRWNVTSRLDIVVHIPHDIGCPQHWLDEVLVSLTKSPAVNNFVECPPTRQIGLGYFTNIPICHLSHPFIVIQ